MRAWIVAAGICRVAVTVLGVIGVAIGVVGVVGVAALASLPAHADHRHGYYPRPYVSFGYAYGAPFYPLGFYDPWYSPWWGPRVGVGVRIDRRHITATMRPYCCGPSPRPLM